MIDLDDYHIILRVTTQFGLIKVGIFGLKLRSNTLIIVDITFFYV